MEQRRIVSPATGSLTAYIFHLFVTLLVFWKVAFLLTGMFFSWAYKSSHIISFENPVICQRLLRVHFNSSKLVQFSSWRVKSSENIYRHLCIISLLVVFLRRWKIKSTRIKGIRNLNVWLWQNPFFKNNLKSKNCCSGLSFISVHSSKQNCNRLDATFLFVFILFLLKEERTEKF